MHLRSWCSRRTTSDDDDDDDDDDNDDDDDDDDDPVIFHFTETRAGTIVNVLVNWNWN